MERGSQSRQASLCTRRMDGGVFIVISLGEFVDRSFSYFFMLSVFSKLSTMKKKSKTIPFLFVLENFQELFCF